MATAAPQLECRRTLSLNLLNTSATARVARLLADKATRCNPAGHLHRRLQLPQRPHLRLESRRRRPAYQARARSITSPDSALVCKLRRPGSTISPRTVGLRGPPYLRRTGCPTMPRRTPMGLSTWQAVVMER